MQKRKEATNAPSGSKKGLIQITIIIATNLQSHSSPTAPYHFN